MNKVFRFDGIATAITPLSTCSKELKDAAERKNKLAPVPVPTMQTDKGERLLFPSSGLKGWLRRGGRDMARGYIINHTGNQHPWNIDEHYFNTLGGIKGKGKTVRSTVAMEATARIKNPLLSLFGAGDAGVLDFVQGRLSVGNAISLTDAVAVHFSGARANELMRDRKQLDFLSTPDIADLISRDSGNSVKSQIDAEIKTQKAAYMKAKKAGDTATQDAIDAILNELKAKKDSVIESSGTDDNSVGMPLKGWLAIPAGVEMAHQMTLVRSTQVELGFLLKTLNLLALTNPIVGAHYTNGHGEIGFVWTVSEVTLENGPVPVGEVVFKPFEVLKLSSQYLKDAVKACDDFFASKEYDFSIPKMPEEVAAKTVAKAAINKAMAAV